MIYSKICLNQTRLCEKQPLADFLKKNIKKLFLQSESKEIAKSKKIAKSFWKILVEYLQRSVYKVTLMTNELLHMKFS